MPELRALGDSGILTPPLVLGASVFGWTADRATSLALLDRFADAGGTLVDTAGVYTEGESERVIGQWLRGRRLAVATKVGRGRDGGLRPDAIARACDRSLSRLGVETIDLYFVHKDDEAVRQEDILGAFQRLIEAGKVRAIGASNIGAGRLARALALADEHGLPRYTVLQPLYNLLQRSAYEGALQQLSVARGIGVMPYFALARGYLTGKYRTADDFARHVRGREMQHPFGPRRLALLAALDAIAAETGASHARIALAWLAAQPGVTAPIASATSLAQLDALIGSWDLVLTPEQHARLDQAGR